MIPLFKVAADTERVLESMRGPLERGWLTEGQMVKDVERLFQIHLNCDITPLAVNSCTSALTLAYRLAGVQSGNKVATVAATCTATNIPILNRGAVPVFVDVDPITGCMDPQSLKETLERFPEIKAITVVHWGGFPVDIDAIKEIAGGRPIIEDCAHIFNSTYYDGRMVGSSGNLCCFSTQAIKFWTSADGGFLICRSEAEYERAKLLRWYGISREVPRMEQDASEAGYKFHMNDLTASILLANYDLAAQNAEIHRIHTKHIWKNTHALPVYSDHCNYWITTGIFPDPWVIKDALGKGGFFADQVHRNNADIAVFQKYAIIPRLPGTLEFYDHMMCIPAGWWMTTDELDEMIRIINVHS